MKKGLSLIELLVVIGIVSVLAAILAGPLKSARQQAKVVVVNAELGQIGLVLELYMNDNRGKAPPTRIDCNLGWQDHQLPVELVEGNYLPTPRSEGMSAGMEDRLNRGHTYKYWGVGELYQNGRYVHDRYSVLWVPQGWPSNNGPGGRWESDPAKSPVTWVVYSHGPDFDWWAMKNALYPVPQETWYNPTVGSGIIVRLRLKDGRHVGSFERN